MRRFLKYRPSPALAVAIVALMVALGGVAFATIPDAGGTVHSCYANDTGAMRVIDTDQGASCDPNTETQLDFNQTGPQGPPGVSNPEPPTNVSENPSGTGDRCADSTPPQTGAFCGSYYGGEWRNWGAPYAGASFYKDVEGVVHLAGLVRWSNVPSEHECPGRGFRNPVIFYLPDGYRPASGSQRIFLVHARDQYESIAGTGRVDVAPDGAVRWVLGNCGQEYLSLDGITFRPDSIAASSKKPASRSGKKPASRSGKKPASRSGKKPASRLLRRR